MTTKLMTKKRMISFDSPLAHPTYTTRDLCEIHAGLFRLKERTKNDKRTALAGYILRQAVFCCLEDTAERSLLEPIIVIFFLERAFINDLIQ